MTQALNLANFANNLNTSGATSNAGLQNSAVTVTAGTAMSGGGAVSLGGSVTLNNAGVTSIVAGTGISISGATGAVTVSSTATGGVSSVNGQSGAVVTTDLNAIGSIIRAGANTTSNMLPNATISGGNLYYANTISSIYDGISAYTEGSQSSLPRSQEWYRRNNGNTGFIVPQGMSTLSGTWRLMSNIVIARKYEYQGCDNIATSSLFNGWFVRVS